MGMNLVSLIMKFLTPDMIGRIASALALIATLRPLRSRRGCRHCWRRSPALPKNPVVRRSLLTLQSRKSARSTNLRVCSARRVKRPSSSADHACSGRCLVETRQSSPAPSANIPGWERPKAARCSVHWARLSWARLPSNKAPARSMGAVSPVFSQARKTTSPPRFPRASGSCLAVQACSMHSAIRQDEQLRQAAKQHGPLPPR